MAISEGNRLAEFFRAVRESSLKRLRLVPAGSENWRITTQSMSFADLAQHLVDADEWLFKKLKVGTLQPMVGRAGLINVQKRDQYLDIVSELERSGQRRTAMLEQITDSQLTEPIFDDRFGREVTTWWIIVRGNLDHEIHSRGQIAAYLSACAVKGAGESTTEN